LRAFVGGALQPEVLELPDAKLEKTVHSELSSILGIRVQPRQLSVCRYSHAMPQYHVGHAKRVQRIEKKCEKWEGLYLTGNAYRGVGIPDCIRDAEATAEAVLNSLDAASSGSIEVLSGGGIIKAS